MSSWLHYDLVYNLVTNIWFYKWSLRFPFFSLLIKWKSYAIEILFAGSKREHDSLDLWHWVECTGPALSMFTNVHRMCEMLIWWKCALKLNCISALPVWFIAIDCVCLWPFIKVSSLAHERSSIQYIQCIQYWFRSVQIVLREIQSFQKLAGNYYHYWTSSLNGPTFYF